MKGALAIKEVREIDSPVVAVMTETKTFLPKTTR